MQKTIVLDEFQKKTLVNHAINAAPNESCALLFGHEGQNITIKKIFLATNTAESPVNFTISNEELMLAYKTAEESGLEVVGIFHSHPHSEAYPSSIDVKFMSVNPVVWIIFSNRDNTMGGFVLEFGVPVLVDIIQP